MIDLINSLVLCLPTFLKNIDFICTRVEFQNKNSLLYYFYTMTLMVVCKKRIQLSRGETLYYFH